MSRIKCARELGGISQFLDISIFQMVQVYENKTKNNQSSLTFTNAGVLTVSDVGVEDRHPVHQIYRVLKLKVHLEAAGGLEAKEVLLLIPVRRMNWHTRLVCILHLGTLYSGGVQSLFLFLIC